MNFRIGALLFFSLFAVPALAHSPCYEALVKPGNLPPEARAFHTNLIHANFKSAAVAEPQRLKISTWNTNLLNVRGWKGYFYKANSKRFQTVLTDYLNLENPDVVMLQEMWSEYDRSNVRIAAGASGYKVIEHPAARGRHGMQLLVRNSIVAEDLGSGFYEYDNSAYVLFEILGSVRRGLLWTRIKLKDGQVLLIGNTHFTAFSKYANTRAMQVADLSHAIQVMGPGAHHTVVGGDLNIAADFAKGRDKNWNTRLEKTRWLYDQFEKATGLRDTYRAVHTDDPGYTYNPNFELDINPNYNGTARRLDYVWTAENTPAVKSHVVDVQLLFQDKIDGVYPSDHFLVQAVVEFFYAPL